MEEIQESSAHTSALLAPSSTIHSVQVTTNMEKEGTPDRKIYIDITCFLVGDIRGQDPSCFLCLLTCISALSGVACDNQALCVICVYSDSF